MAARPPSLRLTLLYLGTSMLAFSTPVFAQDKAIDTASEPETDSIAVPISDGTGNTIGDRAEIYEPVYFAQYAPRNALDMVREIPGFSITGGDGGRGLGQANENVLINGKRLSSKTDSTSDQLSRIPADNVVRIEIVDGTSLDIPGLTGQVANIVVQNSGLSGQFEWEGSFRTVGPDPEWYGGEISISGNSGKLDYTLALENNNNRFGNRGPTIITDGDGNIIERQFLRVAGAFDVPRISANLSYDFSDDIIANLNLSWERSIFNRTAIELQTPTAGTEVLRQVIRDAGAPEYEISGDIEFPLGPGKLKLIGLEGYDGDVSANDLINTPSDGSLVTGSRFTQDGGSGERIGRFEYGWAMWGADWQLAGEAAFNRLDRVSGLFELTPDGNFTEVDFPDGTGGVTEDRYETVLSFGRSLTSKLALQAVLGTEFSKIRQTGSAANARSFQRPKGSVSLAWRPENGLDISLELSREVGQLSFGDVLAEVFIDDENENAGNNELVPEQSWDFNLEINKALGAWGSTTFTAEHRLIEDYVDLIPLISGGEARGNIDSARRTQFDWNTTLKFDPLGIPGAQVDLEFQIVRSRVRDPLDGQIREFSRLRDRRYRAEFRHDIPGSNIAYGTAISYAQNSPFVRLSEVGREYQGPTFGNVFIEHKDVFGLTVNARVGNIFGGRDRLERTVFDGVRTETPILFAESRSLKIGPVFRFSVAGNF